MRLDRETRMTISVLARQGQSGRAMARMLGVTEKTIRYHLRRRRRYNQGLAMRKEELILPSVYRGVVS